MNKKVFKNIKKNQGINSYYDFAKAHIENYLLYPIVKVNGIVTSLLEEIEEGADVVFEDITTKWGNRTYTKTLSVIFTMAFHRLFPDIQADLNHYIGSGLYIDFDPDFALTLEDLKRIDKEMRNIIEQNLLISTDKVDLEEGKEIFKNKNDGIMELLETLKGDTEIGIVRIYDYVDINYSILAPTTSYISSFKLMQYYPGMLLIVPNLKNNFNVENYEEMPKLAKVFQNSTDQYKILDLNKLSSINRKILNGEAEKIIKISEAIFDKKLIDIAENIERDQDIRMVLISGPTSSGKTTFTNRLKVQLEVLGYSPVMISMDDYFLDRKDTPLDENGDYDFESPYAVNLELFNKDMYTLLNEEKIRKREFSFITGKGEYIDEYIVPKKKYIIMVEGIHALNPLVSEMIPEKNKYKIYLSALNQVNLDAHNRVSTTNGRIMRRSVRDEKFRGYTIEETFKMWENIRKSEGLYIFPYQEEADVLVNTSMPYEMNILKKHIKPMLESIEKDSKYYNEARNLLETLQYFVSIEDDSLVNSESLMREFIGR